MRRGVMILLVGSVMSVALALLMGMIQHHRAPGAQAAMLWSTGSTFVLVGGATLALFWQATARYRWKGPFIAALNDLVDDLADFEEADFTVFNNALQMINAVPTIATFTTERGSAFHHLYEKMSAVGLLHRAPLPGRPGTSIDPSVGYDLPPHAQEIFEDVILAGYSASLRRRGIDLMTGEAARSSS